MRDLLYEVKGLLPEKIVVSIEEQLRISEDIDTEVDDAAKNFGYFAILSERADTRFQKMKFAFEQWQAEVETRAMSERKANGDKPFTEAQMKAYIRSQPKYSAFQTKLIELDEHRRVLKIIVKAFEIKSGLIQTKASNRRNEIAKTRR
jgi:hypothetical protein